jgi:hypothetical protein
LGEIFSAPYFIIELSEVTMVLTRWAFGFLILFFVLFSGLSFAGEVPQAETKEPLLQIADKEHDIGTIPKGTEFGWAFLVENKGNGDLKLLKAYSPVPGQIKINMPPIIHPGEADHVYIGQDTSQIQGQNTLVVQIQTNDPKNPEIVLTLEGYVQWPVEILPAPVSLMKIQKGKTAENQFTMVNNTSTEMRIDKIEFDENLFHVTVSELEKGKKFDINIISEPEAPLGEHRKNIVFHTNVPEAPQLTMASWLLVLGRIYANVQDLDFEDLSLEDIQNPDVVEWTREMVLINGMSTPGFKVLKADCDIDFLKVEIDPVSENNVFRVDVFFDPPKARKGEFKGSLKILTNDTEFKKISIPVHGTLH